MNKKVKGRETRAKENKTLLDLPDELICHVSLFLTPRYFLSFFLVDKNIEMICRRNGFYEKRVKLMGIPIDQEKVQGHSSVEYFRDLYIKSLRKMRLMNNDKRPIFRILHEIRSGGIGRGIHFDDKIKQDMITFDDDSCTFTLERSFPITLITVQDLFSLYQLEGKTDPPRIRTPEFHFRFKIKTRELYIEFMELGFGSYGTSKHEKGIRLNISPYTSIPESEFHERVLKDDFPELEVKLVVEIIDRISKPTYSVRIFIDGVEKFYEYTTSKTLDDYSHYRVHLCVSMASGLFQFETTAQVWERSELRKAMDEVKDRNDIIDSLERREYKAIKKIGTGSYGEVWKVEPRIKSEKTKKMFFAKYEIRLDPTQTDDHLLSPEERKTFAEDLVQLHGISHNHIVKTFNFLIDDNHAVPIALEIYYEYMNCGTFEKTLKTVKTFPELQISHIMRQILLGLEYIHLYTKQKVYKNLNLSKIHLNDKGVCKLAPLKPRPPKNEKSFLSQLRGPISPLRMSPERIRLGGHSESSDIWALGMVACELALGRSPIDEWDSTRSNVFDLLPMILKKVGSEDGFLSSKACEEKRFSEEFVEFVKYATLLEKDKRWTASKLLNHPFIKVNEGKRPSFRSFLHKNYIKVRKDKWIRRQKK